LERAGVHKHFARLRYGGRKSAKLVRCYRKKSKDAYRIEVEEHSSLLNQHGIRDVRDLVDAARVIYPKHFRFAEFDWKKLSLHLAKQRKENAESILEGARRRGKSMRRVTRYLRRNGIQNVHRFLVSLALNKEVVQALKRWIHQFERNSPWEKKN
jgi:hypothetical protein